MQACAVSRLAADKWRPLAMVNLWRPPLKPCSCEKPPTGTRREPVTNCSRSASCDWPFDLSASHRRTCERNP
eukprot:8654088-Pyramimonas_sp.AAC.2